MEIKEIQTVGKAEGPHECIFACELTCSKQLTDCLNKIYKKGIYK